MAEINEGTPRAPVTEGQREVKVATADVSKGQHGVSRGHRPVDGQRGQHLPGREPGVAEWPPSVPELQAPPVAPPPQQAQVQQTAQTGQSASSDG